LQVYAKTIAVADIKHDLDSIVQIKISTLYFEENYLFVICKSIYFTITNLSCDINIEIITIFISIEHQISGKLYIASFLLLILKIILNAKSSCFCRQISFRVEKRY